MAHAGRIQKCNKVVLYWNVLQFWFSESECHIVGLLQAFSNPKLFYKILINFKCVICASFVAFDRISSVNMSIGSHPTKTHQWCLINYSYQITNSWQAGQMQQESLDSVFGNVAWRCAWSCRLTSGGIFGNCFDVSISAARVGALWARTDTGIKKMDQKA